MGAAQLVESGPLLIAMPIAAAAGAITFLSPCCLPLVPGYLSYVTGMTGTDVQHGATLPVGESTTRRTIAGAVLFIVGFSAVFATDGLIFGGLGSALRSHSIVVTQVLGGLTIVLGLMFAGAFERFTVTARIFRPSLRPRAGVASAPLLGVLFALSWTPCTGPTLGAVLTMAYISGTAARGTLLAFVYGLGVGIPFLIVAFALQRGVTVFKFARLHARLIMRIGGVLLILVGILEVTGGWAAVISWLQVHGIGSYTSPL
jgi:cytochrome c-type biogenesis protein